MPKDKTELLSSQLDRRKLTPKQIGGGLLAVLSLATVLGGTGCAAKSPEVVTPVTNEAPATNPETAIPSQEAETKKYEAAMQEYKDMDVDSFESLPRDERLLYPMYLINSTVKSGDYNNTYGVGSVGEEFGVEYTQPSRDNNGQEIVNNFMHSYQIAYMQFVEGEAKPFDAVDGQKILSAIYYNVGDGKTTRSYSTAKEEFIGLAESTAIPDKMTATNTSELMSVVGANGEKIEYKDVTYYTESAKTVYARYIYHEFTSYDGKRESIWLVDAMSNTPEELQKDSTIKK